MLHHNVVNLVTNFLVSLEQSIELLYCRQNCNLLQSILCKTDAFGTGTIIMSVYRKSTKRSKERQTNWRCLFEQGVRIIEVSLRRESTVMQEKCHCINKVKVSYKIELHVGVTIKHPFSNLNLQWMIVLLFCYYVPFLTQTL